MTATIATINSYNRRRYNQPWAAKIENGKNVWLDAFEGNEDGGTLEIEDPEIGAVYGFGQKDVRGSGSNTATYYVTWNGSAFTYCDRKGRPVEEDYYAGMLHANWNVIPNLDVQVEAAEEAAEEQTAVSEHLVDEEETVTVEEAEVTATAAAEEEEEAPVLSGVEKAAKEYQEYAPTRLIPRIMVNRRTGEVWTDVVDNENDYIKYSDPSITNITSEVLNEQMEQSLAAFQGNVYTEAIPEAPLADAVVAVAETACRPTVPRGSAEAGAELKRLRQERGYTQSELARKVGITYNAIQKLESGQRSIARMAAQNFLRLAQVLEVAPEALLENNNA